MKTNGADQSTLSGIPVGATLTRVCWAVAANYSSGPEFDDQASALRAAISTTQKAVDAHNTYYPDAATRVPLPQTITLDLRWELAFSTGGGISTSMSRSTYTDIADAQTHLDRIDKFALNR